MDIATLGLRLDATQLQTGAKQAETALRGVEQQAGRVTTKSYGLSAGFQNANRTAAMFREGMTGVAASVVGVQGPLAGVTSRIMMLGAGSALTVGALAGISAIGAAYSALTREAREAEKAQRDLLRQAEETARGLGRIEVVDVGRQWAAVQQEILRLQAQADTQRRAVAGARTAAGVAADPAVRSALAREAAATNQRLMETERRLNELRVESNFLLDRITQLQGEATAAANAKAKKEREEATAIEEKNAQLQESNALYEEAIAAYGRLRAASAFQMFGFGNPLDVLGYRGRATGGLGFASGTTNEDWLPEVERWWVEFMGGLNTVADAANGAADDIDRLGASAVESASQIGAVGVNGITRIATGDVWGGLASGASLIPGVGSIAGAFVGLAGALFGSGQAAAQATARFREMSNALSDSLGRFLVDAVGSNGVERAIADVRARAAELNAQAREVYAAAGGSRNPVAQRQYLGQLAAIAAAEQLYIKRLKEEERLRLAALRDDYEVRRLRALGMEEEADAMAFRLAQEREYAQAVRDGADATTLAALAEAQKAEAIRYQITVLDQQIATAKEAADRTAQTVETLQEFSRELSGRVGSPVQNIAAARAEFERVASLARGGDQDAARRLPELGRTLLDLSRGYYASGPGYAQEVQRIQAIIDAITAQYGTQLDREQQTLVTLEAQRQALEDLLDVMKGSQETLGEIRDTTVAGHKETTRAIDTMTKELAGKLDKVSRALEGVTLA